MKITGTILTVLVLAALSGCGRKSAGQEQIAPASKRSGVPSVLFFTMSQSEFEAALAEDESLTEILDDFNHYSAAAMEILEKSGYRCSVATNRRLELPVTNGMVVLKIDSTESPFGIVVYDTIRPPRLVYMVGTTEDYLTVVREYYQQARDSGGKPGSNR